MRQSPNSKFEGCSLLVGVASLIVAILAWLSPFNPIRNSPLAPIAGAALPSSVPSAATQAVDPTVPPSSSETPEPVTPTPLASDPTSPQINTHTVRATVIANQPWQHAGIKLNPGDQVHIKFVSGSWDWTREYPNFRADGDPDRNNTCDRIRNLVAPGATPGTCPINNAPIGILVGKLSNSEPFIIGNVFDYSVPQDSVTDQTLDLMINDVFNGLSDNDGVVEVEITIIGP